MTTIFQNTNITTSNDAAITLAQGDTLVVGAGVTVETDPFIRTVYSPGSCWVYNAGLIFGNDALEMGDETGSNHVFNSGTVFGAIVAITISHGNSSVDNSGTIFGGVTFFDPSNSVTNSGTLNGGIEFLAGYSNSLTNSGTMNGAAQFTGGDNVVTNSGLMTSDINAVNFDSSAGQDNTLYNYGAIYAKGSAVYLGDGGGHIVNNGTLHGNVGLGGSPAVVDNAGYIYGNIYENTASADVVNNTGTITGDVQFSDAGDVYQGAGGKIVGTVHGAGGDDVLTGGAIGDVLDGGAGADNLKGNGGDDTLTGGLGADKLTGGAGEDTFFYAAVSESTGKSYDTLVKADWSDDQLDLNVSVLGVDTMVTAGKLDAGNSFNTELTTVLDGKLAPHHAVLFTVTTGNLAGHIFLIVDANGTEGYQGNRDYVFDLKQPAHLGSLDIGDFA